MWFQGPLIPPEVAVQVNELSSDDDSTSSDGDSEQEDEASDVNMLSSESDIDLTAVVYVNKQLCVQ